MGMIAAAWALCSWELAKLVAVVLERVKGEVQRLYSGECVVVLGTTAIASAMDPAQTSNQGRIGVEGRGGSKVPGNVLSRSSFRYVFVGGMAALGLTWYASSHGWLGSTGEKMNASSRGGSKPPTVTGKDQVDEAPSATSATKPSPQAHSGAAQGVSEGSKPK